jgi:hypothetical protein
MNLCYEYSVYVEQTMKEKGSYLEGKPKNSDENYTN